MKPLMLNVGDEVNSRWGRSVIERITLVCEPGDKGEIADSLGDLAGQSVPYLAWELVRQRWGVVDLNNGHWAYGDQIAPVEARQLR